ncbi:MAG: hypothetical protein GY705_30635, partial [Bacteroidetes bacterium]|nr:hypothetical protein [Bacteroidota bacterium]
RTTYEAYKELYKIGQPIVPILSDKILETDWKKTKYKELSKYLSGIFSLLHDIDEDKAKFVMEQAIKDGCPDYIESIFHSSFEFSVKNYKTYNLNGVEIFEHKELITQCEVSIYLKKWLDNVPSEDLEGISRLYVVPRKKIQPAGSYMPVLKTIALFWENSEKEGTWFFKLISLGIEKVLYHEIGHHANNHDFGTKPEQEREADKYAFKIMRRKHPSLAIFVKLLSMLGMRSTRNYYRWGL